MLSVVLSPLAWLFCLIAVLRRRAYRSAALIFLAVLLFVVIFAIREREAARQRGPCPYAGTAQGPDALHPLRRGDDADAHTPQWPALPLLRLLERPEARLGLLPVEVRARR